MDLLVVVPAIGGLTGGRFVITRRSGSKGESIKDGLLIRMKQELFLLRVKLDVQRRPDGTLTQLGQAQDRLLLVSDVDVTRSTRELEKLLRSMVTDSRLDAMMVNAASMSSGEERRLLESVILAAQSSTGPLPTLLNEHALWASASFIPKTERLAEVLAYFAATSGGSRLLSLLSRHPASLRAPHTDHDCPDRTNGGKRR